MKNVLLLAGAILIGTSPAFAQAGYLGVFDSSSATNCNLLDQSMTMLTYHVVHISHGGAQGCQFAAPVPACFTGSYMSDGQRFPLTSGNSQTGVVINYGTCESSPTAVLAINLFGLGTTPPCCTYRVTSDPNVPSGQIEIIDCQSNVLYGTAQCAVINPDATCPCWATPVEESTWGKVKSLYVE